jgi:acyl-CoA synthetase (AMP-forming)/AMP-acid ligase II
MQRTTIEMSRQQAREKPNSVAWSAPGKDWTFAQVESLTNRLAQGLSALGLGQGDRVATLTHHQPECAILTLAAQKIGAVCMPVNWRLAGPEVEYILNDGQARFLMSDAEFLPMLGSLACPDLKTCVITLPDGAPTPSTPDLLSWAADYPDQDPGFAPQAEDAALQLYSSGTTGLPKGVELSSRALAAAFVNGLTDEWGFDPAVHVNMNVLPAFHIAGLGVALMTHAVGGTSVTLPDFEPKAVLDLMERRKVSHAFLVPAMIQFLMQVPGVEKRDFSALKVISYGASPISEAVLTQAMQVFGCGFMQVYGMTETCGSVTVLRPADHATSGPKAELLRSAGVAMPGVELRIVRPGTDEPCDDGEVGELLVRTVQNMTLYWRKPEATEDSLIRAPDAMPAWLRTGDAGYMKGPYLFLHDRIKDMIVSGGENIYPAEVENALMQHPDVADGAIIGVPDAQWGEAVKAIVVPRPGSTPDAQAIIEFMRSRIARYKCPKSVDFVQTIPRNPSGKILKRVLREPYWAQHSRRIA